MKKYVATAIPLLIVILFCFLPTRTSDVILRFHFWEIHEEMQKEGFCLFYTTKDAPEFTAENCIEGYVDEKQHRVEFRLDGSLKGQITGIRIDLPASAQRLIVDDVAVLSGGVVKRHYNPVDFFAEEMIKASNDVSAIERLSFQSRAYIVTAEADPYLVIIDELTAQIAKCFGSYLPTRICILIFLLGCVLFAKFPVFKEHTI